MLFRNIPLLPVELVFNPRWWRLNYGISFDIDFFFNANKRIESERLMEKALYDRYGEYGFGLTLDKPIPVAGSRHIAGGFIVPALFGCEVRFSEDAAPWVVPANMTDVQVKQLDVPDIVSNWPFKQLIHLLDKLEEEFGYVLGDFNTGGVLNVALDLRGQQLYIDFYQQPDQVHHLFRVITETIVRIGGQFIFKHTDHQPKGRMLYAGQTFEVFVTAVFDFFISHAPILTHFLLLQEV